MLHKTCWVVTGPSPSLEAPTPQGWDYGLEDWSLASSWIWALWLRFGPKDWKLGLEAEKWASKLRYGLKGGGGGAKEKEKKKN